MNLEQYLDALLTLPNIWRPMVSRDGRWVAWIWVRTGPAADIFVAPTDGSTAPTRMSSTPENTFLISWTPDSRAVIVAQDTGGDERYQLFRIDVDAPLVMVPITEPNPPYFLRGGEIHPNGRWLIFGANYDFDRGEESEPTWIYREDLETGERVVLARPTKGAYIWPDLSPDGRFVLYGRKDQHPAGRQMWLVDIEGRSDRKIVDFGDEVKTDASWFPDGKRLLVQAESDTHRRVGVWMLEDEQMSWLIDDPARNIENAFVPYGSEEIVIVEMQDARLRASLFNLEQGTESPLIPSSGNLLPLAPAAAGGWIANYYSSRQPEEIVRLAGSNPDPAHFTAISRVWERTSLTPDDLTQAEPFHWSSFDGLAIQGWLYKPKESPKGTIVNVHGGPTFHAQDWIDPELQLYARAGFTVFDPNYRGSTGFGLAFREAIKKEGWGGKEQLDIRTGIEALIDAGLAEAGKVGVTGVSYGGYSSWWAITHFPVEVVAAAAPVCGMTDLVVDYETTRPDLRPYTEEMMGGSPKQIPEKFYQRSPINFVDNIKGSLLIVQGGRDPNVTPENVTVVRNALEAAGIPYEILTFDDEGHGISKPKNQRTLFPALIDFFERAFQGDREAKTA